MFIRQHGVDGANHSYSGPKSKTVQKDILWVPNVLIGSATSQLWTRGEWMWGWGEVSSLQIKQRDCGSLGAWMRKPTCSVNFECWRKRRGEEGGGGSNLDDEFFCHEFECNGAQKELLSKWILRSVDRMRCRSCMDFLKFHPSTILSVWRSVYFSIRGIHRSCEIF